MGIKNSILFLMLLIVLPGFADTIDYRVIPMPARIERTEGNPFLLDGSVCVTTNVRTASMKRNAAFVAEYVFQNTGIRLSDKKNSTVSRTIELSIDTTIKNVEGYHIVVSENRVSISGKTASGIFYGIQTLRKSIPVRSVSRLELQAVEIADAPKFAYRGMHLDVARHLFPVDFIKNYIDLLALHNINNFHWHLTDDQGWRIEIKKFPKLTQTGAFRKNTVIGRNTDVYDSIPYGGFYTQKEIKEIVRYAAERYINVIPEIDMPGHMLAALAAYPQLGCTGGPYQVGTRWGVFDDVLCAGNDKTFHFVEKVLSETMRLFPSKYIHIGGDECPKEKWKSCFKCQQRIVNESIVADSAHTVEEKLQSYFINRVEKYLNSKGRQIIGWDEILEGGLAPNATVMSWRGVEGGIAAARQQHNVIMSPNSHLYFNYYQSPQSVQEIYNYNPIPGELNPNEQKYITGVQANLWTEYIKTTKQAEYMTFPRLAALCEVQWNVSDTRNYSDFLLRTKSLKDIYDLYNLNYAAFIFESK